MLSKEENELICQVGPGTPGGNFMREYWIPAALSSELASTDSDPLRVLLLGEKLIAFRDTNGNVGLVQNNCPHRGASLFFGRNEECGLRCVYHGWKFDTDGNCVDMPNEPAESDFKHKVKAVAYPTRERGGVIWAYLGPRQTPPPLPDHEGNMQPDAASSVRAFQLPANYLQILEGDIDTTHVGFLHYGGLKAEDQIPESFSDYQLRIRAARLEVIDTEGGTAYGASRPGPDGMTYWRIAQYAFPFYTFTPPGVLGTKMGGSARVPMDDSHTLTINMGGARRRATPGSPPTGPIALQQMQPNTSDWYGRFRPVQQPDNDFLLDRAEQRRNVGPAGFTGIQNIGMQDAAVTTSMGAIYDRSKERLGSSDSMIIRVRRRLIEAVTAHEKYGTVPPGVDEPEVYHVRSGGVFLPEGADWVSATSELRKAFVEHPELDPALNGPL